MRFLPVNLDALLVELDDLAQTTALFDSLQADRLAEVDEIVPGARTLLVVFRPSAITAAALAERIAARRLDAGIDRIGERVEIPVHYDGEDLAEVARFLGITTDELILRHTGRDYTVAFTGFAPGFAYLSDGDPALDVPRRATPRTRIPAGAVALAGTFSGVYPQASPGGWQIIGKTPVAMWDLDRPRPALLQPGQRVRFVDLGAAGVGHCTASPAVVPLSASASASESAQPGASAFGPAPARETPSASPPPVTSPPTSSPLAPTDGGAALDVVRAGIQSIFQDAGRHGHKGQGVSTSGAMDRAALRRANRLVGNAPGDAAVEIAYGGFEVVCHGNAVVALTGAPMPLTIVSATGARWPVDCERPLALADGDRLVVGAPDRGARGVLAVRGGFEVAPVLGSSATDTLARIGPPALVAGQRLAVRPVARGHVVAAPELAPSGLPAPGETVTLDVVLGPRTDWFDAESIERLTSQAWVVTPQSNRVGVRLHGEQPLVRTSAMTTKELPSEGTLRGSLQVPPNGQPVLFMADHPVTGGYPVIGSVATHHLDLAGQMPIGALLRFRALDRFEPIAVAAVPPSTEDPSP